MPRADRVHVVRAGDCIESIAASIGCDWRALWEHPKNGPLRAKRANPNVLAPGDLVRVPKELVPNGCAISKGATHVFEGVAPTTTLDVRFVEHGEDGVRPLSGVPYAVRALDIERRGTTTSEGRVVETIPLEVRRAYVTLHPDTDHAREVRVEIGVLDPIEDPTGVTQRLQNLGWLGADVSQAVVDRALAEFRREHGLPEEGGLDEAMRAALRDAHDGPASE